MLNANCMMQVVEVTIEKYWELNDYNIYSLVITYAVHARQFSGG